MNEETNDAGEWSASSSPWYWRKRTWTIVGVIVGPLVLVALMFWYMFYRPIEVTRGPWQVLDPGRPVDPLKFELVGKGTGSVIEPGDLIQISLTHHYYDYKDKKPVQRTSDNWWIWIGFRTEKETVFHTIGNTRFVSTFAGLREGDEIEFLESPHNDIDEGTGARVMEESVGNVYLNPFGNYRYRDRVYRAGMTGEGGKDGIYIHRDAKCIKNNRFFSKENCTPEQERVYIHPKPATLVFIKKVFKGQLKYRTTHLYDDTWVHHCYNFLSCEYTNAPREGWVDDARYEGVSADGQRATFQYGPVEREFNGPRSGELAWDWLIDEWKSLPIGVQLE
jgi:hypothetical protein